MKLRKIVIILLFLSLLLFNSNSFAFSQNELLCINDVITGHSDMTVSYVFSINSDIYLVPIHLENISNDGYFYFDDINNNLCYYHNGSSFVCDIYHFVNSSFVNSSRTSFTGILKEHLDINYCSLYDESFLNSFIYSDIDKGTLLFLCPVQGVVVPVLGEAKELPKAIVETLKMIIPVGLVLLGIIVLIYLIKRVISLSH